MDWHDLLGRAAQQNAVFWAGAAAVALGFALLAATLLTQVRQKLRRPFAWPRLPARLAAAAYEAPGTTNPSAPPSRGAAATPGLVPPAQALPETQDPPAPSLAILLRRLQLAGDRFEEVMRAAAEDDASRYDTGVKEDLPEVEYVFKACAP